jgi:uncharacterized protein YeaO (DUF488 family)
VIVLKRAYESASPRDGRRFLVERLWPRGVTKQKRRVDAWLKDAAPTIEFRKRYRRELDAAPEAWAPILAAGGRGRVTLVYSSHDTEHNNAVVLREYVGARLRRTARARRRRLS